MMKGIRVIWRLIWKSVMWFFILSIGLTVVYRFVPVPITPLMVIRVVEQAFDAEKEVRLYKDWVPMSQISRHAPRRYSVPRIKSF